MFPVSPGGNLSLSDSSHHIPAVVMVTDCYHRNRPVLCFLVPSLHRGSELACYSSDGQVIVTLH